MEDERNLALESLLDPPPPPGYEEAPKKTPSPKKRAPLALFAAVCALILCLGIWIGTGIGKSKPTEPPITTAPPTTTAPPETTTPPETTVPPETTTPPESEWEANLLRADPFSSGARPSYLWHLDAQEVPVFGSGYQRKQIASVTFLDTLADAPEDAWDVSEAGDGRVMAWVTPSNELYDLYIAAEGGINAANACEDLFAGYSNAETISFGEAFHTTGATDMSCMFLGCEALTKLNLNNFNTSNVQYMNHMFRNCDALTELNLSSFDTSSVNNMRYMFAESGALTNLNLSSFDTSSVLDMQHMFYYCYTLTELDLSNFDASSVYSIDCMFLDCKSLRNLTLSESLITNLTGSDPRDLFTNCPAGADYQHLLN